MYLILLLSVISIPLCHGANTHLNAFEYSAQGSWGPTCQEGRQQSPIDIIPEKALETEYERIKISKNADDEINLVTMSNKGHSVTISSDKFSEITISGGGLGDEYKLAQFHFHWGKDDMTGSEHLIDGKAFPLEMHAVTIKTKFADISKALEADSKSERDSLAVFGVLFDVTDEDKSSLDAFKSPLDIANGEEQTKTLKVSFRDLLPKDVDDFFRYEGSLTTPGCNERVKWTLFKEKMTITKSLMQTLRMIKGGNPTQNYRKPQPINGRVVSVSQKRQKDTKDELAGENGCTSKWSARFVLSDKTSVAVATAIWIIFRLA